MRSRRTRRSAPMRRVALSAPALALAVVSMLAGCAAASANDTSATDSVPATSPGTPDLVYLFQGSTLMSSGPGGASTEVLAEIDAEAVYVASADSPADGSILHLAHDDGHTALDSFDVDTGDTRFVASDCVGVVGSDDMGRIAFLTETADLPELRVRDMETGQEETIASSVLQAVCGGSADDLAYVSVAEDAEGTPLLEEGSSITLAGPSGESTVIGPFEPERGPELVRLTESSLLYVVPSDAGTGAGDLYRHERTGGDPADATPLLESVRVLDVASDGSTLVVATVPDPGDPTRTQPTLVTLGGGPPSTLALGDPLADGDVAACFSGDVGRVAVSELTLGRADRVVVYDTATGETVVSEKIEAGTALADVTTNEGGDAVYLLTQTPPYAAGPGIGTEALWVLTTGDGERRMILSSDLEAGEGPLSLIGTESGGGCGPGG